MRKIANAGSKRAPATASGTVTRALLRAADRLGISNRTLSKVVGLSEASVSRMGTGIYALAPDAKAQELALLFIRLFRSLDSIAGGDEAVARAWLRNNNIALGGAPIALIESVPGLVNVLAYLDARRALI